MRRLSLSSTKRRRCSPQNSDKDLLEFAPSTKPNSSNSDKEMSSLSRKYVLGLLHTLRGTSKDYATITAATSSPENLRKATLSSVGCSPGGV